MCIRDRYFIVYVIFAVFFTVGMYLITKYEENAKATQIALLLAEHPEPVSYTHLDVYKRQKSRIGIFSEIKTEIS